MIFPFQMFAQFPVTSQSGKLRESLNISHHLCLHKWFHFLHSYQSPAFGEVEKEKILLGRKKNLGRGGGWGRGNTRARRAKENAGGESKIHSQSRRI